MQICHFKFLKLSYFLFILQHVLGYIHKTLKYNIAVTKKNNMNDNTSNNCHISRSFVTPDLIELIQMLISPLSALLTPRQVSKPNIGSSIQWVDPTFNNSNHEKKMLPYKMSFLLHKSLELF